MITFLQEGKKADYELWKEQGDGSVLSGIGR